MSATSFRFGLVGWPLGHSLSPVLHQAALSELGLAGDYRLLPIPPPEGKPRLIEVLSQLACGALQGLNVTIPWKEDIRPFCDLSTHLAESVGAANTLFSRSGKVITENTDVPGFLEDLYCSFPYLLREDRSSPDSLTLVLGTGGAARAAVYALARDGWRVAIAGRDPEKAKRIVKQFCDRDGTFRLESASISYTGLSNLIGSNRIVLIVNATSAGMYPNTACSPWPAGLPLPNKCFLYDMIYNPAETLLVREARQAGLGAVTGAGMLVEQAALSLECWTGLTAPRRAMRRALDKELADL